MVPLVRLLGQVCVGSESDEHVERQEEVGRWMGTRLYANQIGDELMPSTQQTLHFFRPC